MGKPLKRIVWAVDPYSELESFWTQAEHLFRALLKGTENTEIFPVYVIGPVGLNWVGQIAFPQVERFVEVATRTLEQKLKTLNVLGLKSPQVIVNHRMSRRWDVEEVLAFTERAEADLLVLSTHGREGASRFLLGSFAETALLHSHKPVLILNPTIEKINEFRKVLFPTDFSIHSKKALEIFLSSFPGSPKEIVLYNKVSHPIDAFVESGVAIAGGGWVSVEEFLKIEVKSRQAESEKWERVIKAAGHMASTVIEDSSGPVVEGILSAVKKENVDLVALTSESGPISSVVLGSVARNVVRHSSAPVWVLHPED